MVQQLPVSLSGEYTLQPPLTENPTGTAPLTRVTYQSRIVDGLDEHTGADIARKARHRNRALGITGLLIQDRGRFVQSLEGPAEAVHHLLSVVRNDNRHTDVNILATQPVATRAFGVWHMHHVTRSSERHRDAWQLSTAALDALHTRPELAPVLLTTLAPIGTPEHSRPRRWHSDRRRPALSDTDLLRAGELARLVIQSHADEYQPLAATLCASESAAEGSSPERLADLITHASRALGDLWLRDDCSEFDVTVGLQRLLLVYRTLCARTARPWMLRESEAKRGRILVVPCPGEAHFQRAAREAELLHHHGWAVHCPLPANAAALDELLEAQSYAAVLITLSDAFPRSDRTAHVRDMVTRVRSMSRNRDLRVLVSGRHFDEHARRWMHVGADASAPNAAALISRLRLLVPVVNA